MRRPTKLYWLAVLVAMITSPAFAWTEITLQQGLNGYQGTTDAWLNHSLVRHNYGGAPDLRIQWNNGRSDCAVIKFDLAGAIPPNQRILSATLSLYYFYAGSMGNDNAVTIKPFRLAAGAWWDENIYDGVSGYGVSYRYRDANETYEWTNGAEGGWYDKIDDNNGTNKIKKTGGTPPDAIEPGNWVPFDVTPSVTQWYGGATNNGFLVVATNFQGGGTLGYGKFYSRNEGGSSVRPTLTIRYEGALEPVAEADGPYSVGPGQSVRLDARGSYDPDGGGITAWLWDLDNDGLYDDASGEQVDVTYEYLVNTLGLAPGDHIIGLKVIDDENEWDTDTALLTIRPEESPVAEADGPYTAYPGGSVILDGSGSYDPDGGEIVAWLWDLDNDGLYDDASGELAEVTYDYLVETLGLAPGEHTIGLEVMDEENHWGVDTASLTIVAETMPPVAEADGPYIANPGQSVTLDGSGSYDPDGGEIVAWLWDLDNDGDTDVEGERVEVTYQYLVETLGLSPGDHTIVLRVLDDEEESGADTALLRILPEMDFGDAPPPYPTLAAGNGATHAIVPGVHLGLAVDAEPDGQPDQGALGDDANGIDDEDGVRFLSTLTPGKEATIEVIAGSGGFLDAWVDFSGDGSWADPTDQIFASVELRPGSNSLNFQVPVEAKTGTTFARFRFSTVGGLSFVGKALDGEVEDYAVKIQSPGWGAADSAEAAVGAFGTGAGTKPTNYLAVFIVPFCTVILWKRIRRK